jgi:hypothetical protein
MTHRSTVVVACLAGAALLAAGPPLAQAGQAAHHGKLKVKPKDVMVNTSVQVKGSGFAHKASITLRECGRTFWIVPEEPCGNSVTVHTNSSGRFATTMKAEVCPEGMPGKEITERTCYIGVPQFGEDTGELSPSVKLIVTYP